MTTKKDTRPLAVDVCPNARRCQHSATSRVGANGRCPDCGTQIFSRPSRGPRPSGRGAAMAAQVAYHGGFE